MPGINSVLLVAFFVNHSLAYMFRPVSEVVRPTYACLNQTRKCALDLQYSYCSEVIEKEINCTIRTVCAKREFMYMYDLACRGEQLLTVLRKQLDPICVKRLESQTCGTGAGSLTIFDYGNKSVLYRLCDKVQENPVAICLAGDSSFERADCTKPQYAFIISIVCAGTGGASSARQLDVRLLIIPLCTCIFIVVSSSMLLPRLSEAECKIHGVFH